MLSLLLPIVTCFIHSVIGALGASTAVLDFPSKHFCKRTFVTPHFYDCFSKKLSSDGAFALAGCIDIGRSS